MLLVALRLALDMFVYIAQDAMCASVYYSATPRGHLDMVLAIVAMVAIRYLIFLLPILDS